jgi:hypothetical protein
MSKRAKPLKGRQLGDLLASQVPRRQAPPARAQKKKGEMNGLESRFVKEWIMPRVRAGDILWWAYESMTWKIAPNTTLTPDFLAQHADGRLVWYETKGFMREDAWIKLKIAEAMQPIPIYVCRHTKSNGWSVERVHEADGSGSDAA